VIIDDCCWLVNKFLECINTYSFFFRNIKRVIFYSITKPITNKKGEKEIDIIPASTALQIGGRAGRYGTAFEEGEVTTFNSSDLPLLKKLLKTQIPAIEVSIFLQISRTSF